MNFRCNGYWVHSALVAMMATAISGCENFPQLSNQGATTQTNAATESGPSTASLNLQERDVEAPDIFNATDLAIWDGRPSFGGVWVAYPGNQQPERVNIRNVENGNSVVGALFKREEDNPGPPIRLSSDAAQALEIEPGTPARLTITALRREPIEIADTENDTPVETVVETVLDPVAPATTQVVVIGETQEAKPEEDSASAASNTSTTGEASPEPAAIVPPAPIETPAPVAAASLAKPYIQVGTFSSEKNATALLSKMKTANVLAQLRTSTTSSGKKLFRIIAGPAKNGEELKELAGTVAELGFSDAFPVAK